MTEIQTPLSRPDLTKQYLFLFGGQLTSQLGSSIVQFVIIWYLTAITNSGMVLAIASLLGVGSSFVSGLFAGVLADRYDRKKIIFITDFLQAMASFVLMYLFFIDVASINHIYGLLLVRGLLGGIQTPSAQAIIPSMVPKEKLSRINSLTSLARSILNLGTPVVAAILLGIFGTTNLLPLLAIDGMTFILGIIPLFFIFIPADHVTTRMEKADTETGFRAEFMEGLAEIKKGPGMLALLFSFSMTNFFLSSSVTFLPLIVISPQGLAGNEFILAFALTSLQAGNLLASIILSKIKITTALVRKVTMGILGGFLGLIIGGAGVLIGNQYIFVFGIAFLGLSIPIAAISSSVIWQTYYPNELQGRIFTVRASVSQLIIPIALVSVGSMTEYVPASLNYLLISFGTVGFVLYLLVYKFTRINDIDRILEAKSREEHQYKIEQISRVPKRDEESPSQIPEITTAEKIPQSSSV